MDVDKAPNRQNVALRALSCHLVPEECKNRKRGGFEPRSSCSTRDHKAMAHHPLRLLLPLKLQNKKCPDRRNNFETILSPPISLTAKLERLGFEPETRVGLIFQNTKEQLYLPGQKTRASSCVSDSCGLVLNYK